MAHESPTPTTEDEYLADLAGRRDRSWPTGLSREVVYPLGRKPVTEYLRKWARRDPERALIIFYGRVLTFAQIDELSDRFAAFLLAQGIERGDRVAVLLPNCPQFVIAFYGILKAAAVHVPVNPMFREEELAYELEDSGARLILAWDRLVPMVEAIGGRTRLESVVATSLSEYLPSEPTLPLPPMFGGESPELGSALSWDEAVGAALPTTWPAQHLNDLAALNYTGGTTGMPKGCEHTQWDMLYTAACATSLRPLGALGDDASAVGLVFVPVFWIAGEDAGLIIPVVAGSTCVLLLRWDPEAVLAAIDRYKVTSMAGTVDNYLELMEHPKLGDHDLSSLRAPSAMSFVTKLRPDIRDRWKSLVGDHSILREGSYGMTETHTIDTFVTGFDREDHDLRSRPVFCGLPMPGTELAIRDFDSGALVPLGREGEIWIRTPSLFRGYWRRPEATAEAIRDGWLHTGDIGMLDDDGCLHFLGRRKEMLKINGMSVFPSEIEVLLGRHPAVKGSGVIGTADPARGEAALAFVELRDDSVGLVSEEELEAWCRQNMATYKVPRIRFVAQLPLTATGKVKKHVLAEGISAG